MHKTHHVFPTIGGRKVEHLYANIEALEISLSKEQIAYLESILPFDVGFPNNLIVSRCVLFTLMKGLSVLVQGDDSSDCFLFAPYVVQDRYPKWEPIKPPPKAQT